MNYVYLFKIADAAFDGDIELVNLQGMTRAMTYLSPREKEVLYHLYSNEYTLSETG